MRFAVVWGLAVLLVLGGVGFWFWLSPSPEPETPVVQFVERPHGTSFVTTLAAGARTFACQEGECRPAFTRRPGSGEVSDGTWRYSYQEGEDETRGTDKILLTRQHEETGEQEVLMESTPLTSPRGLFLITDRHKLALWVVNVGTSSEELTELWVLDTADTSIRLLAEKLFQPDIRSDPAWNAAGQVVYFVADTGAQTATQDQLELIVVDLTPTVRADFASPAWGKEPTSSDVSPQGTKAALVTPGFFGSSTIHILSDERARRSTVRGQVAYLSWVSDEQLLYAVQSGGGVTLWQAEDDVHRFLARRPGNLRAARMSPAGDYVVLALAHTANRVNVESVHLTSGTVITEGSAAADARLVVLDEVAAVPEQSAEHAVAPVLELDDEELVAFVENQLTAIAGPGATPARLVMTDSVNALFLEYRDEAGQEQRILLRVHDAVHAEWSISARYQPLRGEWQKTEGSGLADPSPLRLYEWEPELNLWVFKQDLAS